ncbi:Acriflavine sensitivity control acr-2 [Fusarium albosuccineum]|uniref:Acriflavine sensitivity control acr-2 n=1 Tax=Fusarium albosuccineum TaxID=1237068 RepID=A0A8H4P7W9_9HYPO|nr:Acriflavine sensitivity control acr-2 [Fusarium albosuccineum]
MLLGQHQTTYNLAQQSGFRRLVGDIAMFEVLGSTLCRPGALASSPRWQFLLAMLEDCYIVGVGCPKEILLSIGSFAMQRRGGPTRGPTSGNLEIGSVQETLRQLRSFDVQAWATKSVNQRHSEPSATADDLLHVGHIWKLTAEIYGFHVLSTLKQSVTDLQPPTLSSVIEEFGSLERNDEELLKCLVWPTFVVGAASTHWCQRQWAYQMCNKIWEVTWSANAMNAKLVLADLWDKQDLKSSGNVADADGWDWITELSKLDDFWLFA